MKKLILCLLLIGQANFAQTTDEKAEAKKKVEQEKAVLAKPYHEEEDALLKVKELLAVAQKEHKKVLIQVGGNWCIWCLRLNDFINKNETLKQLVDTNYLYYHLNWSPKNKNEKFFSQYEGNPGEKHGYPVFMILEASGKLLKVQETGSLEEGKGYSFEKVKTFLASNASN
ncbi:thioredoxin family protein [Flavobacterium columnare]|uniref:thioredoxin family protein n=1 Tax=Flavobacterium columnare TaxID=996 RepID=UPI0013D53999|nr:thioredoxin family protein [Flavobacterium columnare]